MRALLINEASGVHRYLQQGLEELGHEAILAMPGSHAWQGRPADHYFGWSQRTLPQKVAAGVKQSVLPSWTALGAGKADVVQFLLSVSVFKWGRNKHKDLDIFKRAGSSLSHYALGCDEVSLLRIRTDASDLPCASCQAYDPMGQSCERRILGARPRAAEHASAFDFSVSAAYEYSHCHEFFPRAASARIPLPVNTDAIEFTGTQPGKRPLIIHAPTRRGFKGTRNILRAIELMHAQGADFDFSLIENLSHTEYLDAMRRADIHLDQVFTYSCGVAALESLAMGKVVFSGNRAASHSYFPFAQESPVFDAADDPDTLAADLMRVLARREEFGALAVRGRGYVERNHGHVTVARQFAELWEPGRSHSSELTRAAGLQPAS